MSPFVWADSTPAPAVAPRGRALWLERERAKLGYRYKWGRGALMVLASLALLPLLFANEFRYPPVKHLLDLLKLTELRFLN